MHGYDIKINNMFSMSTKRLGQNVWHVVTRGTDKKRNRSTINFFKFQNLDSWQISFAFRLCYGPIIDVMDMLALSQISIADADQIAN
jgi:hypothetical protein